MLKRDGDELEIHYRHTLEALGKQAGLIGVIFRKAQNKIQDPAKLRRLIADLIDKEEWSSLDTDVKGDAYEGLLEKNAADVKGGAGQYFTPRPLIQAIVDVVRPKLGEVICDPACGTGGFLLAAYAPQAPPQTQWRADQACAHRSAARRGAGGQRGAALLHEHGAARHRRRCLGARAGGGEGRAGGQGLPVWRDPPTAATCSHQASPFQNLARRTVGGPSTLRFCAA
ncbi:MAG: HsdM family class I SAM-dependent methyltransferase, partial [Burkholderiales bacterium]